MNYKGVIIEESLEDKNILKDIKILSTEIEKAAAHHETSWLSQWTKHEVDIPEGEAASVAGRISRALDRTHGGTWYADFKNDTHHYIIYRDRVFRVNRKNKEEYDEAEQYGLSLGIPEDQLINYEGEYRDDPT